MSDKKEVVIDLEEIRKIQQRIDEINGVDIKSIQIVDGANVIEIDDRQREEWKYTGLTNFYWLRNFTGD